MWGGRALAASLAFALQSPRPPFVAVANIARGGLGLRTEGNTSVGAGTQQGHEELLYTSLQLELHEGTHDTRSF